MSKCFHPDTKQEEGQEQYQILFSVLSFHVLRRYTPFQPKETTSVTGAFATSSGKICQNLEFSL